MDNGHENLIRDLESLLAQAKNFEFHDFKNEKYPAPKIALASLLHDLRMKVIDGIYDN